MYDVAEFDGPKRADDLTFSRSVNIMNKARTLFSYLAFGLALSAKCTLCLKIIGAGLPRTGTSSLREALGILGYRTYHMLELIRRNRVQDFKNWTQYFNGTMSVTEFADTIYDGFDAAADFPTCNAWKELAEYYPNAQIILTHRENPETWWESINAVTANNFALKIVKGIHPLLRAVEAAGNLMWKRELRLNETRFPRNEDLDAAINFYQRHFEAVKLYDPDRTLVFDVRQGWEPLCRFLGKPIPDVPFPKVNTRRDFKRLIVLMGALAIGLPLMAVSVTVWAAYKISLIFSESSKVKQF